MAGGLTRVEVQLAIELELLPPPLPIMLSMLKSLGSDTWLSFTKDLRALFVMRSIFGEFGGSCCCARGGAGREAVAAWLAMMNCM